MGASSLAAVNGRTRDIRQDLNAKITAANTWARDVRQRAARVKHAVYDLYACRLKREPARVRPSELLEVSPDICTNLFAFSYSQRGWHYLTALLREHDATPSVTYQESVLRRFHARFQPTDMTALVAHRRGITFAPPIGVYPWGSFETALSQRGGQPKSASRSRQFGPTDDRIIQWDFSNLFHLYHQLRRTGYQPEKHESGFISGVMLCRTNGDRRFFVVDGTHRCAILSRLGARTFLARYAPHCHRTIREQDVDQWYYVRRGQCSRRDALAYFHAYFELNGRERADALGLLAQPAAAGTGPA